MPGITQITEALIVATSDSSFDCSPFQTLQRDGIVAGGGLRVRFDDTQAFKC